MLGACSTTSTEARNSTSRGLLLAVIGDPRQLPSRPGPIPNSRRTLVAMGCLCGDTVNVDAMDEDLNVEICGHGIERHRSTNSEDLVFLLERPLIQPTGACVMAFPFVVLGVDGPRPRLGRQRPAR